MIIGVSAKKQGGKSTMVNVLRQLLPDSKVVRFADFLKEIVLTCFVPADWGWTIEDLDHDDNKTRETPCGITVRGLLQIIGTDWFRHTYQDCWITAFQKRTAKVDCRYIFVPDVRFSNELKAVQMLGGKVIRLTRAPFGDQDQHESETSLDEIAEITARVQAGETGTWAEGSLMFDSLCDNRNMSMDEQAEWTKDWVKQTLGKGVLRKKQ